MASFLETPTVVMHVCHGVAVGVFVFALNADVVAEFASSMIQEIKTFEDF